VVRRRSEIGTSRIQKIEKRQNGAKRNRSEGMDKMGSLRLEDGKVKGRVVSDHVKKAQAYWGSGEVGAAPVILNLGVRSFF